MRITLGPILFIGLVQIIRAQGAVQKNKTEHATVTRTKLKSSRYRDPLLSRIWQNRTIESNDQKRIKALAVALQDADTVLNSKRSRKNELSEKPRKFDPPMMTPERGSLHPMQHRRRSSRLRSSAPGKYSEPSPILLPPYKSYSPEYDFENRKKVEESPKPRANALITTLTPPENSTVSDRKLHEISSALPVDGEEFRHSKQLMGFSSLDTAERKPEYPFSDMSRKSFGNLLNFMDYQENHPLTAPPNNRNISSSYVHQDISNSESLKVMFNGNSTSYLPRGMRYGENGNRNRISKKMDLLSPVESSYNWRRRVIQTPYNHFKFIEPARKIGSIPGVPGRDYPVHQQYVHNHLRNPASRFICPVGAGTHIYLADRASRCQIFYVCYGSQTGVPMMCPNGTLFSEPLQVCDWWFNVIC